VRFLLASLDTPDPCVRELAVRLVAEDDRQEVENGLVRRLAAPDSSLRMVAALGLGIGAPQHAVDALMRATRDDAAGVRANAVWGTWRRDAPRPPHCSRRRDAMTTRAFARPRCGRSRSTVTNRPRRGWGKSWNPIATPMCGARRRGHWARWSSAPPPGA